MRRARTGRLHIALLGGAFLVGVGASPALAHPLVDEGRRLFGAADFEGALAALEQAYQSDELTLAELVELLETRVLVYQALGNPQGTEAALRTLAAVAPDHAFAPEVPPGAGRRFREIVASRPGTLEVDVRREESGDTVRFEGVVRNDPDEVARAVRLHAHAGDGEWRSGDGELSLVLEDRRAAAWYAEVIGPGGTVLATEGSRAAPRRFVVGEAVVGDGGTAFETDRDDGTMPWLWMGIGGAALVVTAAIVLVLIGSGGETQTRVDGPSVEMP